ncbi:MAG: SpoIIIAH-like family protein [Ruminococcaceae bacterium]|nr:SpoIIIAH-like family protein [Oscillospiraceae bacterium]
MKKGKVIGKKHIALVVMVLALGAAVWLNMKFSSDKYLGEAKYVNSNNDTAIETAAKVETDYFAEAKKEREKALKEATELVEETLKSSTLTDADKKEALNTTKQLATRIENEVNIETLLKAKGFEKAVAVIGEKSVNIIVKSDGLTTAQTLQIQDIVTEETKIPLSNIKIVTYGDAKK